MKIKVGRKEWEIVTAKILPENDGETRFQEGAMVSRQVVLREDDLSMRYTLFHEICHVMSFDEDLGLTEKQVLGMERWFKKFEKNHCLCELLDAYTHSSSKRKSKE